MFKNIVLKDITVKANLLYLLRLFKTGFSEQGVNSPCALKRFNEAPAGKKPQALSQQVFHHLNSSTNMKEICTDS